MNEITTTIRIIINGNYQLSYIKKSILGYNEHMKRDNIVIKISIDGIEYINTKIFTDMGDAIIDLQGQLPNNIQIACCHSCEHGNFCPYGNAGNKIYCFKNYSLQNYNDVYNIFDSWAMNGFDNDMLPINELLHWCELYKNVARDSYSYNSWINFSDDDK